MKGQLVAALNIVTFTVKIMTGNMTRVTAKTSQQTNPLSTTVTKQLQADKSGEPPPEPADEGCSNTITQTLLSAFKLQAVED